MKFTEEKTNLDTNRYYKKMVRIIKKMRYLKGATEHLTRITPPSLACEARNLLGVNKLERHTRRIVTREKYPRQHG